MRNRVQAAAIVAAAFIGGTCAVLLAQASRSVWDGVYSEDQAKRGAVLFDKECAGCHGPDGEGGGMAPALSGAAFNANYDGQSIGDLFDRNKTTMPIGKEGQLSGQQIADITAFMLQANKFPSGASELAAQTMTLKMIKYLAQKPVEK
jgi:mono/diheme cytochrome c family protein